MIEFAKVTLTRLGSRVRVLLAQLRLAGAEGADDDAEPADDVEVLQPLGLFARPVVTAGLQAVVTRLGDEVVALLLRDKSQARFTDAEEGETRLYGVDLACHVRLRALGDVEISAKATRKVYLKGGAAAATAPVAHEGSATTGHTHNPGTFVAGPYAVTGISASATDTIAVGAGSANVLVPDT